MNIVNSTATDTGSNNPCTMITEVELIKATTSYPVGAEAALKSLNVNGKDLSASALASGSYDTRAIVADVAAAGKDNAAVTILPAYENQIKILLESEDHAKTGEFVINLGSDTVSPDLGADDDARDYPVGDMTPTASNEQGQSGKEGPVKFAFDGDHDSIYHSLWSGTPQDELYVDMTLEEPTSIEALRYLPRQQGPNGLIEEYSIWYHNGADEEWVKCAEGTWDTNDRSWQIAQFDEPVTASQFRFKAEKSLTDKADKSTTFMSAAEIRLRKTAETVDLNTLQTDLPSVVKVDRVDADHPVLADQFDERIVDGERVLVYGVDYLLTFQNNTAAGTAKVLIEALVTTPALLSMTSPSNSTAVRLRALRWRRSPPSVSTPWVRRSTRPAWSLSFLTATVTLNTSHTARTPRPTSPLIPRSGPPSMRRHGRHQGHLWRARRVLSVTVNKASQPDPGPDPDPVPPVDPDTDPNPPVSPGGGNTGSGAGDSGANKPGTTLPGTGDASMLSIVVLGWSWVGSGDCRRQAARRTPSRVNVDYPTKLVLNSKYQRKQ